MPDKSNSARFAKFVAGICAAFLLVCASLMLSASSPPDNPPPDAVGLIEGESVAVNGPMSVEMIHGQSKTMLRSGSDVRIKSGTAHIELLEGGQISICGPAHLSVLKSGGALTIALDTGTIHVHVENDPAITVYTPLILAKPMSIGGGAEDLLVGFESPASMCIRANSGAIRIEQQFTGQSVLIPQNGDIVLTNGQIESLRNTAGHCSCALALANAAPPEVSRLATSDEIRNTPEESKPKPAQDSDSNNMTREDPVYQVVVPPLVFDAKAKVQPEIDPKMILLVRRVRVRPTLIFQGRVEGEQAAVKAPPSSATTVATAANPATGKVPPTSASNSFMDRARRWWRKIWTPSS